MSVNVPAEETLEQRYTFPTAGTASVQDAPTRFVQEILECSGKIPLSGSE